MNFNLAWRSMVQRTPAPDAVLCCFRRLFATLLLWQSSHQPLYFILMSVSISQHVLTHYCVLLWLLVQGFDPVYGARPVKRALQRELQTLLAQALLRGEFAEGDTVLVEAAADGSSLILHKLMPEGQANKQLLMHTQQSPPQPQLANGTANGAPAAAANGVGAGAGAANGAPAAGKKKVIRLVRKTKSTRDGGSVTPDSQQQQMNGSGSGGSKANGLAKAGPSGTLQSMPIILGDSSDAEH
jgi:hypothetical protein